MSEIRHPLRKYMRPHVKKTTTCPGCGNGIIVQAILRAIDELGWIWTVSLSSRASAVRRGFRALFNADTLHTTHGRPIAFATGVKLGRPDQKVMVASGDVDLAAIGGNHLIHAARKNTDITVILVNNGIYAMTGGQTAPTTPRGVNTTTNPYGTLEHVFDISSLVVAAGAPFVARWTTFHPRQMTKSLKKAITTPGFAFIEVISQCPVQYGKVTKSGNALDLLKHYKQNSVRVDKARGMGAEDLKGKIIVGEFVDMEKPELSAEWNQLRLRVMEGRS